MNTKVVKNSLNIMVLIIIGKVLAFIRDALIAAKFGASYSTDIYMFSLGIVYLLTTISYGLTTTFIPLHTEYMESYSKEKSNNFVNNILNMSSLFTVVLTMCGAAGAYYIVYLFAPGFKVQPVIFNTSVNITRIMLLSLIFISMQSVVTGVLQAHKEFYEPSAMAIFSNIVYIGYLIILAVKFGITGFAWATVAGFLVQLLINIPKYKKLGYSFKLTLDLKDPYLRRLVIFMVPVIISISTPQISLTVNRFFASTIQEGAVSALDFSNKLNALVYEVFAVAISMVIYPVLSSFAAQKNNEEYKKSLLSAFNIICIIMVPAAVAMGVLRYPIINIIFKRGAFDEAAVTLTASAFLFYCPSMIAYGLRDVLNKAFYSIQDTKTPMINSLIGIALNIVLNVVLIKVMKLSGLTLASTLSAIVTTVILILRLNKKIEHIGLRTMIKSFLKISLASLVMGICLYYINNTVIGVYGSNFLGSLISISLCFIIGLFIFCLLLYLLRIEEYTIIMASIKKKIKK